MSWDTERQAGSEWGVPGWEVYAGRYLTDEGLRDCHAIWMPLPPEPADAS